MEDDLNIFENKDGSIFGTWKATSISWEMEDDLIFVKLNSTLIFQKWKMTLIFIGRLEFLLIWNVAYIFQ